MKKVLLAFFLVLSVTVAFGFKVSAAGTGNLVIHFQKWDGDYSMVGINTWGDTAVPGLKNPDEFDWEEDDFGVKLSINGLAAYEAGVTEGTIGFQAVLFTVDNSGETPVWSPDWNNGKLANVEIPRDKVVDGKTTHVYLFEGGISRETSEENFAFPIYADPDKQGVMIVYFDPTNSYEENLGVHSWGWADGGNAAGWNDPLQIFTKVGRTSAGTFVYAGILEYADPMGTPGAIVYYGAGDDSKKTNNLEPANSENAAYIETPKAAGELDVLYVLNKGNIVTNENVWLNDPETFADEAFTFRLVDFDLEEKTGTYAVDPTTIIVKTSALVESPYPDAAVKYLAQKEIESWFEVRANLGDDTYGSALTIDRVDFATTNETIDSFVVILKTPLVNTADYTVFFNNGEVEAQTDLAMDTEAPIITFISPSDITGVDPEDRIIEVAWGAPFNQNLFPRFRATDDRDGDLTPFVFVPKGEFSVLDTRTEGDYEIMLRVVDEWGNVTEETFIFRVVKE
jgi:hypothetical protein